MTAPDLFAKDGGVPRCARSGRTAEALCAMLGKDSKSGTFGLPVRRSFAKPIGETTARLHRAAASDHQRKGPA